jgi:flagellar motor switch protein FliN/FliY
MIIDQDEINELLSHASELTEEAETQAQAQPVPAPAPTSLSNCASLPSDVKRTLRLRVPVIVRLAERLMSIREIMGLSPGSIIEFDKLGDAELDLMINNRVIGFGSAVKVGENFGLRIQSVGRLGDRIRSMGA